MSNHPFSITISAITGDPNGLRVVEHSAWYGKALILPRSLVPDVIHSREEFSKSAVYLLIGPREDGLGERLYIGEADPLRERIQNHFAKKDFWNRLIFFTGSGDQLNKTHVKFLEARLLQLATSAKRVELENKTSPSLPSMSESERIRAEGFLRNILEILPILGVHAFEVTRLSPPANTGLATSPVAVEDETAMEELLYLRSRGIEATGYESSRGFVVREGSQAVKDAVPSMETHSYSTLRNTLIQNGVLEDAGSCLAVTQDYIFDSPSAAAAALLGRVANGRTEWRTETGITLKQLQTRQAAEGRA
jgi:hypothetical protein